MLWSRFILSIASETSGSNGIVRTFGCVSAKPFSGIVFPNTISLTVSSLHTSSRSFSYPFDRTGWISIM